MSQDPETKGIKATRGLRGVFIEVVLTKLTPGQVANHSATRVEQRFPDSLSRAPSTTRS